MTQAKYLLLDGQSQLEDDVKLLAQAFGNTSERLG
ncbi:protein of unknown function,might releated with Sensory box protein [Shewanella benthica]|uniref:Uncharacterized protein n=1 Tax=Shewanella benthica TaxID=43661 RepID=A0A330M013_9GAMM|nr:protein of unknown function,might releated with Sensory box protein [Shewanella benthica]